MNSNDVSNQSTEMFLQHREALVEYALPFVGDRMRAEDVVQEAWLRFSSAIEKDRGEAAPIAHPVGYLYRIVRNLAIDVAAKVNAEAWHPASDTALEYVPSNGVDPEQEAVDREQLVAVANALDELPPRTRRAFDLHRFEGKTYAEIAEILGLSQARAHGLVKEALTHCMDRLDRWGRE